MDDRQITIFLAVMRTGTATAAANALGLSQPAVSKALRLLEEELGYRLFERLTGRLVPTSEARSLEPEARRVRRASEALGTLARDLRNGYAGLFRVGTSLPVLESVLPKALRAFRRGCPEARLHIHALPKRELAQLLETGELDVAFTLSRVEGASMRARPMADIPIVVLMREDDPLAGLRAVGPRDLGGRALISYGSHAEAGMLLDKAFLAEGVERRISIRVASSIGSPPLVREGLGLALVDALGCRVPGQGLVIRPFSPRTTMPLTATVNEAYPASRFNAALLDIVAGALGPMKD